MQLSKSQRKELKKLLVRLPEVPAAIGKPESFALSYVSFEAVARKVWHYYRCRSKTKSESKAGIPVHELAKALRYFELYVDDSHLFALLGSSLAKRGQKSARNIRNGIFHSWSEQDCKEVTARFEEFATHFDAFQLTLEQAL